MLLLGVDIETTGLDCGNDEMTEIGFCLWDTDLNDGVISHSLLLNVGKTIPSEVVEINGITNDLLNRYGNKPETVQSYFFGMAEKAEYCVAHNATFEKDFLRTKWGFEKPFIDTMTDIKYRGVKGKGNLVSICGNHGILITKPHRALPDVIGMMQVAALYDWNETITRANEPNIEVFANVPFSQKDKAKDAGFHWDGARKVWFRNYKESDYKGMVFDFPVTARTI